MQKNIKRILSFLKKGKSKRKASLLSLLALATITSGVFIYTVVLAVPAITTASGGTDISIDTTSGTAVNGNTGSGTYTTLGPIIITEPTRGDIAAGQHTFTLPAGWEFDTSSTIGRGSNGGESGIDFVFTAAPIPSANSFSINIQWHDGYTEPGIISLSNLRVRPTGTTPSPAADITHTAGTIVDVVNGTTSFGTLSSVPGTAAALVVTGAGTQTAGVNNELTITAYDQFANVATGYTGTKSLTFSGLNNAPDGNVPTVEATNLASATSVDFSNGISVAGVATLVAYAAEAGVFVDVTDGTISSTGNEAYDLDLAVTPATAGRLEIAGDGAAVAGISEELTITAKDDYGNVDISYDGDKTLVFSSLATSPNNSVPTVETIDLGSDTTVNFSTGVAAAGDFDVTLVAKTAETADLHVADNVATIDSTGYDLSIAVTAGTFSSYTVATQNSGTEVAGTPFTLTITPVDDYENLQITGATNGQINFTTDATNSPNATAPSFSVANETLDLSTGAKTTSITATLTNAGETPTITATANVGGQNGATDAITVNPAATAGISFNPTPSTTGTVDVIFTTRPVVEIVDTYGNVKTDETGTATINDYSDAGCTAALTGVMAGDSVVSSGGSATFDSFAYQTAGSGVYLQVSLGAYKTACVGPLTLTPGAIASYTVSATTSQTAGTPFNTTVTALDQYNNTVTTDGATQVTMTSSGDVIFDSDGNSTFDDNTKTLTSGTFTISTKDTTAETITITATDGNSKTGVTSNIVVDPDSPTKVKVETADDGSGVVYTPSASLAPNDTITVYAISRDAYDNFVANVAGDWVVTGGIGTLSTANGLTTTLTATTGGTGVIQVTEGALTPTNSGNITVAALTEIYVDDAAGNDVNSGDALGNAKKTIQAAVNAVASDGTVNVAAGTYAETVTINKALTLQGAGATTIINPAIDTNGIDITTDNVTVKDLKITSSSAGVDSNIAINIQGTTGVTIDNTTIITTGNKAMGIWAGVTASSDLTLTNNTITLGGQASGIYGAKVSPAHSGWTVSGNTISAPTLGVDLELYDVDDVSVTGNTFETSGSVAVVYASELSSVSSSTFSNNIFNGNGDVGGVTPGFWIESDFQTGDGNSTVSGVTISGNTFNAWTNAAIQIGEVGAASNFSQISGVTVSDNNFVADAVAGKDYTDIADVTWSGNTWGNFSSNTNYPLTYLVDGTATSVDTTPVGALDADQSTIGVSPTSVTTDGGATATVTITAKDASGTALPGIAIAKYDITSDGTNNTMNNQPAGVSDGNGQVTVTIASTMAETKTISATIGGVAITGINGSKQVTFTPGALNSIAFTQQPSTGDKAGVALTTQPIVTLYDVNNNILTNDDLTEVVLTAVQTPGDTDPGNGTVNNGTMDVTGGVATFSEVNYTKIDAIKLKATAGGKTILSSGIQCIPGDAASLRITGTGTMTAGTTNELTITAYDAYDNVAAGYIGAKNLTFSGLGISPNNNAPTVEGTAFGSPVSVNFAVGVSDVNAATLIAYRAQSASVDVNEGIIIESGGNETYDLDLIVNPAAVAAIDVTAASPVTTAQTSNITINGTDTYGNINTSANNTVSFLYSGDGVTLTPPTGGDLIAGVLPAEMTKTSAGSVLLTVTSPGLTQDSVSIVFNDGTAPYVDSWTPADGSTNVSISYNPVLTFSEDMDPTTLIADNIKLRYYLDGASWSAGDAIDAAINVSGSKQVVIIPAVNLAYGTQYYFWISAAVTDANDVAFLVWDETNKAAHEFTTEAAEAIAPTVVSWAPADDAIDVLVASNIWIKFSEALNPTTINSTNIELRLYGTSTGVPATYSLQDGDTKVVITPNSNLAYGTQYYFFIGSGIKDAIGNSFVTNTWWQNQQAQHEFTTKKDLIVDSYVLEKGDATANGFFADGWRYRFDITTNNTSETNLKAKFTDWEKSVDGPVIPIIGNARMLIDESSGGAISTLGGFTEDLIINGSGDIASYAIGNEYTDQVNPADITGLDNNGSQDGQQITFYIFFKIPVTDPVYEGSYTTTYGILTE